MNDFVDPDTGVWVLGFDEWKDGFFTASEAPRARGIFGPKPSRKTLSYS
jgi:hypothetical protein